MKHLILLGLALLMCASSAMAAENPSGTCGTNCNWVLENGKLSITGGANGEIGTMDDYSAHPIGDGIWENDNTPWKNYVDDITSVDVKGIKNIGATAFIDIGRKGVSVNLDDTIEKIGYLSGIKIAGNKLPTNLKFLDSWAISGAFDDNIPYLELPDTLKTIGSGALRRINVPVIIPDSIETISNNGTYSAFGGKNIQIICRGTQESCKHVQSFFSKYCPLGGIGCKKEEDFIDLSGNVVLADESQCNSSKYYWTGSMCSNRPTDGSMIECDEGWYATNKDVCARIKLRYTLPEADAATSNDNENMIEWIFE
ncbi:MAG: hypothetical protein IJ564_01620 [Alphaproteobacteria bacterium]|nr:hypothetical protein [Alphaproteobacteria bacterium]